MLKANAPGRLLTCSLRPHLIWGPTDPHLIPRLIDRCKQGRLVRVGSGKNLIDTVHVESAARAHRLAIEAMLQGKVEAAGRSYFVTDGQPIECWSWVGQLLSHYGLPVPKKSIPYSVAYSIGYALEKIYGALGKSDEPPLTRFVAAQLGKDHYFSIDAARSLLGYDPTIDRASKVAELT